MSFVYAVSDGIKTKIGFSKNPTKRVIEVAHTVFSRKVKDLNTLMLSSTSARRAEDIMKSVLSETWVSAGGIHPTETFFIGFDDACAIARWSTMIAEDEVTASIIGYRKKRVRGISVKCRKTNMKIAMIRKDTKLAWLARKINISQSSMHKAASGSEIGRHGLIAMANAAEELGVKLSELIALGEDNK